MRNNLRALLYVLILLLPACHPDGTLNRELNVAGSMMEEHPDTALYVLQKISETEQMDEEEYATYCLLLTQAKELTRAPHTSNETISAAVDYFKDKDNILLKAKSYYYLARVNESIGEDSLAEQHYQLALNTIEKTKEYKETGLIYTQLGELYVKLRRYEEAYDMQQRAYNNYLLANNRDTGISWYMIFIPSLFICMLLILLIYYKRKWNKKEQEAEEKEQQLIVTRQIMLEQKSELSGLKKELRTTQKLVYNSSDIIRKIKAFNDLSFISKEKLILSEQEWNAFLNILEETYGFVSNLQQTYPRLTDVDIRICALLKEKISTAHISTIMCMLPETLAKRMQRIKVEKMGQGGSKSSLEKILNAC